MDLLRELRDRSTVFRQEMGVPQGSILSVTLFALKINYFVKMLSPCVECFLYVNDFPIYYRSKFVHIIERQLQQSLINKLQHLLRLRSSHVVDTLDHTLTPVFSVSCRFFSLLPRIGARTWGQGGPRQILEGHQDMASTGVQAYNEGLGWSPQQGPWQSPQKPKTFLFLDVSHSAVFCSIHWVFWRLYDTPWDWNYMVISRK